MRFPLRKLFKNHTMRQTIIAVLLISIPFLTKAQDKNVRSESIAYVLSIGTDGWLEIQSNEGKFRIVAPGEMKSKVDSIETEIGKMAYHTLFYQSREEGSDNLIYMLSYCDYPAYTMHSDSLEVVNEFFDVTMESAQSSVKGELIYSDAFTHKDYPGRFWRIDYLNGQAVIKTKALLVGRRYYALQTITKKSKSLNRSTDRYLDSFRLLE